MSSQSPGELQLVGRPIADREDAIAFIESLIRAEPRSQAVRETVQLAPMRALLQRLGNPDRSLRCLHIAGSKGKGSTALITEHLLQASGRRTGLFTSPHLERWTERFQVDGTEVDDDAFTAACERVRMACAELVAEPTPDPACFPSFFDVLTAAALVLFQRAAVDVAILETGLGGRLDATNAVTPALTCITSIELEHTDKLGGTIAAIAAEKAGIVKTGVPLLLGPVPATAAAAIRARARQVGAPVQQLGHEVEWQVAIQGDLAEVTLGSRQFFLGLPQAGLAANHALAVLAVVHLVRPGPRELHDLVARLRTLCLPGRLEFFGDPRRVLLDGAHTHASVAVLVACLDRQPADRLHLLTSVSGGRDPFELLAPLLVRCQAVTVTQADPVRSMTGPDLALALDSGARAVFASGGHGTVTTGPPTTVCNDPETALQQALEQLAAGDLLVVAGSMYLAGRIRSVLLARPELLGPSACAHALATPAEGEPPPAA